jgi:hypothetical protein
MLDRNPMRQHHFEVTRASAGFHRLVGQGEHLDHDRARWPTTGRSSCARESST